MAYPLNSAADATGDEHLFVQRFEQNRPAIEAYKRSHGGAYEDAYQAVVGEPWPAGRSVKISNGRVEMTKDRTLASVMGKYVLPAAAGALTGGAALGAFGGAGAAGAGAAAGGGGVAGGGLGTGALAAGATIPGAGLVSGAGLGAIAGTGALTTGATMASRILPWITRGLTTAAQLYGANRAANTSREAGDTLGAAAERAAQLQYDLGREALGFQREQWNTAQENARPWMQAGQSALGRLTGLTGLSSGPQATPGASGGGGYGGPELVLMRAPDGSQRPVPRVMVPHYQAAGGQVIGPAGGR